MLSITRSAQDVLTVMPRGIPALFRFLSWAVGNNTLLSARQFDPVAVRALMRQIRILNIYTRQGFQRLHLVGKGTGIV